MKKVAISLLTLTLTAGALTGCTEGNNTGGSALVGAAAGGLIGSQFFHGGGAVAGVIGATLLGGFLGYKVGQYMDRQDQANMRSAIATTPVGDQATWTNPKTNVTYQVKPVRNYNSDGRYCREYQTKVQINGKWQSAYGKACRQPDGSWKIVK